MGKQNSSESCKLEIWSEENFNGYHAECTGDCGIEKLGFVGDNNARSARCSCNRSHDEWNVRKSYCWSYCEGGACEWCEKGSEKGYCCRKDGKGGNKDCPMFALHSIPDSIEHHTCVSRKQSK